MFSHVYRVLLLLAGFVAVVALTIASVPWVVLALARLGSGDGDGFDRTMESAPVVGFVEMMGKP